MDEQIFERERERVKKWRSQIWEVWSASYRDAPFIGEENLNSWQPPQIKISVDTLSHAFIKRHSSDEPSKKFWETSIRDERPRKTVKNE